MLARKFLRGSAPMVQLCSWPPSGREKRREREVLLDSEAAGDRGPAQEAKVSAVTCRVEAISVSGSLKFPRVEKRIQEARQELFRVFEQHFAVRARLQGRVMFSVAQISPQGVALRRSTPRQCCLPRKPT